MMEVPKFAEKLGNGKWVGIRYVLDRCPVCQGKETMQFTGKGMWGCTQCHKGGKDIQSFKDFIAKDPLLVSVSASIEETEKPEELIVVSEYVDPYKGSKIGSGFGELDFMTGGFTEGALTVFTGKRGAGKSTLLGQLCLNAIQTKHNVCFYSGELSAGRFQSWLFTQAAGVRNLESYTDQFGAIRYNVKKEADEKIRKWINDRIVLYDNTKVKSSERRTIVKSFCKARQYYGSDLFIVDNLMTARYDIDDDQNALRAQANFAAEMLDFARQNNVHVILVAHPRKGEVADVNDAVAGFGDITNMATNVMMIDKIPDEKVNDAGCDSVLIVAKNREYGDTGKIKFNFDKTSKRFIPLSGSCISKFGWEEVK